MRRILALLTGLPLEAATWREERPQWTQQDELAAINAEATDAGARWIVTALTGKVPKGKPLHIDHPHRHGGRQRRRVSMGELMKGG